MSPASPFFQTAHQTVHSPLFFRKTIYVDRALCVMGRPYDFKCTEGKGARGGGGLGVYNHSPPRKYIWQSSQARIDTLLQESLATCMFIERFWKILQFNGNETNENAIGMSYLNAVLTHFLGTLSHKVNDTRHTCSRPWLCETDQMAKFRIVLTLS